MLSSKMCLLALCGNDMSAQMLFMDDLLMDCYYFYLPPLSSRPVGNPPGLKCGAVTSILHGR